MQGTKEEINWRMRKKKKKSIPNTEMAAIRKSQAA